MAFLPIRRETNCQMETNALWFKASIHLNWDFPFDFLPTPGVDPICSLVLLHGYASRFSMSTLALFAAREVF
jgi:hypothetical protein